MQDRGGAEAAAALRRLPTRSCSASRILWRARHREILQRLKEAGITRFLLLFRGSRSRSEVVATFLAVLELCQARICIRLAGRDGLHRPAGAATLSGESDVVRR